MLSALAAWSRPDEISLQKSRALADAFFTNGVILRLQIEIAETDVESLRKEPRKYVKAVIRDGETVHTNVNIHLKGSVGSFRPIDDKPGLTISLKPADASGSFHGLKKFHLNNGMQDGSFMSEWICGEMFRTAGVPATRTAHALVELNGRKLGLYVLLESMNKDFLSRFFTSTEGNLYGQSQNGDVTDALERMEGKGENNRADLKALAEAAQEFEPVRLHARLQEALDIDAFISFMAMEVMLCHWDGYTIATHNFRLYHNPDTKKSYFLPHDFDQMLMEPNSPIHPGARGIIARDILKIPETRASYRERLGTLFTNVFVVPTLTGRIDHLLSRITPAVTAYDPALAKGMKKKCDDLKDRIVLRAQAIEQQLKTPPPENLVLQVNVMDAETQMLIPRFNIIPGFRDDNNHLTWDRTHIYRALRGSFILDVAEARLPRIPAFFKFVAEGFLPSVVSYRLSTNAEDAVFNIELKKGGRLSGTVRLPDGTPARGAEVVLLTETANPILSQAQFVRQPGMSIGRVLDRGRFSFEPDPEAHSVVVAHENGFMESSMEDLLADPQITLQPWGCVEASLLGGGSESAVRASLTSELSIPKIFASFYSGAMHLDPDDFTVELSTNAPIAFTNVPPGELFVWRSPASQDSTNALAINPRFMGRRLSIKSGATNRVVWGGRECSIEGRISLIEQVREPAAASQSTPIKNLRNRIKLGVLKLNRMAGDAAPVAEYFFNLHENNDFRVLSGESGAIEFDLRVYSPPKLLGIKRGKIVLPPQSDMAALRSIDWGAIQLDPIQPAQIGDPAPLFNMDDLDGAPLNLADFRGKFVLLLFWASWGTPQFTILPSLKEIWQTHQTDPRFVMIGLSLDRSPETTRRYVHRNAMPWRQGCLGEWFHTSLPSEYGVAGIPSAILIGPDGKILSKDCDFSGFPSAIKKALQGN